jgi:hypothetical protein
MHEGSSKVTIIGALEPWSTVAAWQRDCRRLPQAALPRHEGISVVAADNFQNVAYISGSHT